MPPNRRLTPLTCCLLLLATAAFAAPPRVLAPQTNLPVLAAEPTCTKLIGLLASGDVKTTFTNLEANLDRSPARNFEARSTQAKTTRLLWQVAVMPFPTPTGQAWQSPPGLIDSGILPDTIVPDGKHAYYFRVDLGYYLNVARLNQPMKPKGLYPIQPRSTILGRSTGGAALKPAQLGWGKWHSSASASAGLKKTEKVVTFYLRVVPLDAKGERVGNPSAAITVRHNAKPSDFTFYQAPPAVHPVVTPTHWQPERHQDPNANYWRLIVRRPPVLFGLPGVPQSTFTSVKPGEKYAQPIEVYWPPKDKDWWDKLKDAVGDFVSWVADAVNYVSNLYSNIKGLVIDGLSAIAPELRGVFSVALDIGLVAVGIPPSLPDFDDLQNMGADYLCEYIADETGIPAAVTKEALKQVSEQTKDARHGGGDTGKWLVPDYNKLYRPARVDLLVSNPSAKSTDRVTVFCNVTAPTAQGPRWVAAGNPVPLPPLGPGESLTVPVYIMGAPEYAEQVRLSITTQMRYELDDKGLPINGKSNPYADQYNRLISAKQEWSATQLQQAPQP